MELKWTCPFGNGIHVLCHKIIALWVEEYREAPGILEGDQMGFTRIIVQVQHPEGTDLLLCIL